MVQCTHDVAGRWPATSVAHYTISCNTQSSAPEDGQNNCPKNVELTGISNKPLLLHLVGCLYSLYQWCTVKQISDNEIYLLIEYIKIVLWRVAKHLSYIQDARCVKVKHMHREYFYGFLIFKISYSKVLAIVIICQDFMNPSKVIPLLDKSHYRNSQCSLSMRWATLNFAHTQVWCLLFVVGSVNKWCPAKSGARFVHIDCCIIGNDSNC